MFSLSKIFGRSDKFFDLLEQSAEESKNSILSLLEILKHTEHSGSMNDLVMARRQEKLIAEKISEELVNTFVTSLEKEDIEILSKALYRIPKTVEKFAERYDMSMALVKEFSFTKQAALLAGSADAVSSIVKFIRVLPPMDKVKTLNDRLQYLEGEADKAMLERLRDLYSGKHEALKAMAAKDLYELLEEVVDRCRDVGNIVTNIVLKNS